MPTKIEIPARSENLCSPCEHLKSNGGMRGGPGNVWDLWHCMHPKAYNGSRFETYANNHLPEDLKDADEHKEIRYLLKKHGRSIGKSLFAKQPSWCPLRKQSS